MSISSLENENSQVGYVFIGKDITSSKYKKRIFNYGNSYLFVDSIDSHKTFFDLLNKDRNSLFISRNIPYELKNKLKENKTEILILNKEQLAFEIDLKKIYNKIKENILKNKFNIIFMERIDYLITVCGFESFINLIYDINDLISNNSSLFMLNINTGTLEDKYLNLLKYELITLTEDDSQIEELEYGLLEILELIFMNKNRNLITSFSHIKDEFHISSVTTRKRVLLLKNKGLIEVIKKGRLKILSLTEKANKILEKK